MPGGGDGGGEGWGEDGGLSVDSNWVDEEMSWLSGLKYVNNEYIFGQILDDS